MKELRIKFDFSHGPIWKDRYDVRTGEWSTGIDVIDNDQTLSELNDKAEKEYTSLYFFDKNGVLQFDAKAFDAKRNTLATLLQAIILRINSLNDGSFNVIDEESNKLVAR